MLPLKQKTILIHEGILQNERNDYLHDILFNDKLLIYGSNLRKKVIEAWKMSNPINRILNIAIFAVLAFILAVLPATAGLQVSGATFEAEIAPGQPFEHLINVSNYNSVGPMDVIVDVLGYGQSQTDGVIEGIKKDLDISPYTARNFIKVSPEEFHLEPEESKEVVVSGIMPLNIGDGSRYAVLYIHTHPIGNGSIGIALAGDVPVRLTVKGSNLIESGEIKSVEMDDRESNEHRYLSVIFENTGNHHYKAKARAIFKNEKGEKVANIESPLTSGPIIPMYSRGFLLPLDDNMASGTYFAEISVIHENGTILDSEEKALKI